MSNPTRASQSNRSGEERNDAKKKVTLIVDTKPEIDIYNDPLYNEDGSRNTNIPFSLYASRKLQEEREQNKKLVSVSQVTRKDKQIFQKALKKLQCQRQSKSATHIEYLKNLALAREAERSQSRFSQTRPQPPMCPLNCSLVPKPSTTSNRGEKPQTEEEKRLALKMRLRPVIRIPPLKTKPWVPPASPAEARLGGAKRKARPVIVIPPFKTCKWVPQTRKKPKPKVKIEYPPLTMRSTPWKPKSNKGKKKVPRVRLDKVFYPMTVSKLGKTWHHFKCLSKLQILRGQTSQYSKKFNFVTNGKQSTFIAAVALAFAQFHSMTQWKSQHLDEIILYGDINCRRQIRRFRHQSVIKPCEIDNKIYLRRAKVLIEMCERIEKGIFEPTDMNDMKSKIEDIVKTYKSLLISYCGQCYALWTDESAFYVLNSEDTNESGKLIERSRGGCCAIRSTSLNTVIDYLVSNFRVTKQRYEIYSFRVDKVIKIEEELEKVNTSKNKPLKVPSEPSIEPVEVEPEQSAAEISLERPKSGLAAILFRHQPEPIFGDSFQRSSETTHGFLTCASYLSRAEAIRAPFISSVAILMLRVVKSSVWMSSTMAKVFEIGHALFVENVVKYYRKIEERKVELEKAMEPDPVEPKKPGEGDDDDDEDDDNEEDEFSVAYIRKARKARLALLKLKTEPKEKEEIPITEFTRLVVELGRQKLEVSVENVVIGKVQSRKVEEMPLKVGLETFFRKFDQGIIVGPDVVAVWREQNYFFMFDPNHCDQYQRADMNASVGNSCLSWFKNLSDLVQHYINNLRKNQRGLVYKICKIDSRDFIAKANDWHNFKAIGSDKWIVVGNISETSEEFRVANRGHQSTCMSCVALAKSRALGIVNWKSEVIDDVVRQGDEFYSGCILQLKEKGSLVDADLAISDIGPEFQLENSIVDFTFEESFVYGKLLATDDSFVSLERGLEMFFNDEDMGVVIAAGISLAVFRFDGAYFLFDSHARDDLGRNLKTLDPVSLCSISGAACLLRFTSIQNLASHMLCNFEIGNATMYSINKVDVNFRLTATPCLFHYKPFGTEGKAAILRAYDEWHEDCERFKTELDQKTLCNLFACLCFAKILNPHQWSRLDLNEILKIGFKLLCTVANDLDAIWTKLSNVEICTMRMKAEKMEGVRGYFVATDKLLPDIDREFETLEEHIRISEIVRRESVRKSQTSQPISEGNEEEPVEDVEAPEDGNRSSIFPPLESATNASKLPLLDILKSWNDQKEVLAILTSSLFNIAIFKMNRLYFIFDPKATNDIGMLVQKRFDDFIKRYLQHDYERLLERFAAENDGRRMSKEEEYEELIFGRPVVFGALVVKPSQYIISMNSDDDEVTINESGSSYAAWFTTIELLYEHILSKIPEKFRSESFVIHNFTISNEATSELSSWNSFDAISQNHWILRASLSQNDTQFPLAHRDNQDVPNCVISMMFARLCNSDDWNSTVLDVILNFGERLYKKSLIMQASQQPVQLDELKLDLSRLDLPVFIRPFILNVDHELVKRDLIVKSTDETPLANFKETVGEFLTSSTDAGLLIAKTYHVAIWKCDDAFMMFDPHDVGPDGIRKSTGFACLQRFSTHNDLVDTFWHSVKGLEGTNEYQLVKISLKMDHYNDGVDEEFEQKFGMECAVSVTPILPKTIRAMSVQLREECVEMTICYAIATLCVSQSLEPEYYTQDIIDRIILLGNELAHECRTNDEFCFKDFDLSKRSSCPDEINWNFQLNNTFASIQMDIFQRGVISKHPCPLPNLIFTLEEFFNFHSIGVLVTCDFITALWKDVDVYFMFYACPINEQGTIMREMGGYPGLVSFKSVFDVYNNILSNVRNEQGPFELRICTIAMSDDFNEKCENSQKKKTCKEIIMPAVSLQDPEYLEESAHSGLENQERQRMIEALKNDGHNKFLKYNLGGFLCGSISKNSKTLDERTRKYHAPTICAYCAAVSALRDPNCWNSDIIDAIIISGNSLYVESSVLSRKAEVAITNVVPSLCIGDCKVLIKVEACMELAQNAMKTEHFISIFEGLFGCRKACYVMRRWDCWMLTKSGNIFFLFDPLGIEVPGKKKSHYRATLYRFDSIRKAATQLIECIKETSPDKDGLSLEIGCVGTRITERKSEKQKKVKKAASSKQKCGCN